MARSGIEAASCLAQWAIHIRRRNDADLFVMIPLPAHRFGGFDPQQRQVGRQAAIKAQMCGATEEIDGRPPPHFLIDRNRADGFHGCNRAQIVPNGA